MSLEASGLLSPESKGCAHCERSRLAPGPEPFRTRLFVQSSAVDARAGATAPTDSPVVVLTAGLSLKAEFHFEVDVSACCSR